LWEKETTPQMTSIFASNGPQPFTSSTHQRLTFGQHFFGILHQLHASSMPTSTTLPYELQSCLPLPIALTSRTLCGCPPRCSSFPSNHPFEPRAPLSSMQFSLIFHLHALTAEHLPSCCCTACCVNCAAIGAVHLRRASLSRASPGSSCLAATVPGPTHSAFTMVALGLPRSGRVLPVRHAAVHPPTQPSRRTGAAASVRAQPHHRSSPHRPRASSYVIAAKRFVYVLPPPVC
jgi:hypothetical protein